MAESKANKAAGETQEPLKKEKKYKVTCGTSKDRNEALQRAAEARSAGVDVSLVIDKTEYILLHAENMTKAEAEVAKKEAEAKKVNAWVSGQ